MSSEAPIQDSVQQLTVEPEDAGQRLDTWLHAQLPDYSRSRLQGLIRKGHVLVDGHNVRPHAATRPGAVVTVTCPPPQAVTVAAENIPLDILFEDSDLVVVNKAAGLVVHPAVGNWTGTLVNALLYHCKDLAGVGGELRPGIVHRLDKDTSGVMVVAKNDHALQHLVDQFKAGTVRKEYAALVRGVPRPPQRRIETLIGRSRHDRKKMSAQPPRGRTAITNYIVAEAFGDRAAQLAVTIETGRTHQIRVHMAHVGHPVLGDSLYGRNKPIGELGLPGRQLLHARHLVLKHPVSNELHTFEAPLPQDMCSWSEKLRTM
ncbi:MAG: RluA family pseudouridine synthase [Verrucomicrobia bacterium]|jgi:23S rRNA pseudouridine1911/1915/1917 synthase|nr:RluA family pseudouridine synthase [Verrucomicrobiota bacterium]MBT7065987.1 RluA family pseudouridine synthase [Verrucomicrobiota bacterium]MBT7699291.1 RluA family pseudouridine synthase [Verrucomicrobiota bacterium]